LLKVEAGARLPEIAQVLLGDGNPDDALRLEDLEDRVRDAR